MENAVQIINDLTIGFNSKKGEQISILKNITTKIKRISIYNPLMGIMNTFDTSKFDFKGLVDKFYPLED